MGFEKPQDYVDALKRLEGFSLMGLEVRDGHLFFNSPSSHVALPLRHKRRDWGYRVGRYGLNNLDERRPIQTIRALDGEGRLGRTAFQGRRPR